MSMKQTLRQRAAAVKAAAKGRSVLVFAAHKNAAGDLNALEKSITAGTFAKHSCTNCGTQSLVTSSLKSPMCVTCGTPSTKAVSAAAQLSDSRKLEVTAGALDGVSCAHCSTINVLPRAVLASAARTRQPVHCSACGQGVIANSDVDSLGNPDFVSPVNASDDDGLSAEEIDHADDEVISEIEDGDDDFADLDDVQSKNVFASLLDDDGANGTQPEQADALDGNDGLGEGFDDDGLQDPLSDGFDGEDEGLVLSAAEDEEGEEDEDEGGEEESAAPYLHGGLGDDAGDFDTGFNLNPDGSFAENNGDVGNELKSVVPNDMGDGALASNPDCNEDLDVYCGDGEDMLTLASFDNTSRALSFVTVGSRLVAMKGHTAVAVLQKERAKQNASIMHGEAFAEAVVRVADRSGLKKALSHFQFDAIRVPSVATARSQRQIASFQASVTAKAAEQRKEQASCFALAAAGLARGKFKGAENALAKGLNVELSRLGVRNPKPIVASLLSQHGLAYAKQLVTIASKLGELSVAARKETADALDMIDDGFDEDFIGAETTESLDTDGDGEVEGEDFTSESEFVDDNLEGEDYVAATLLRPARVQANVRYATTASNADAASIARDILSGRLPTMFRG